MPKKGITGTEDRPGRQTAITPTLNLGRVKRCLLSCGYSDALLRADFRFGDNMTVPLAGFAQEPVDARSACIAVIQPTGPDAQADVSAHRPLDAPVVIALRPGVLEFWKQRMGRPELVSPVSADQIETYFRQHECDLSPDAVIRAKTRGRLDRQYQLEFVDAGLMPLVEEETGQHLADLIGSVYRGLRKSIWPGKTEVTLKDGHWLIKAAFWLLAGKILHDKRVPNFITLDLRQPEEVFRRVARHYDSSHAGLPGVEILSGKRRQALEAAAQRIATFSHLGHVTTESLSYVYESALITKSLRKALGTHSTPQYLVDYVVWKLAPWIEEIPETKRHVFEPACGHAAFLVASIRLLKELLSEDGQIDRQRYLRNHLHGIDIDSFAIEIARLSLTLADIPNPNGWNLMCGDMFAGDLIARKAQTASILLGNPPFENFTRQQRQAGASRGSPVAYLNKTAEVLGRVLPRLPMGGVFGFVVPQGVLHSKDGQGLRSLICRDFEIEEICLFPDRVFSFSDAESAIILGRRVSCPSSSHRVSYRRVREADMDRFRLDYEFRTKQTVLQGQFSGTPNLDMCLPDLFEVWAAMKGLPRLDTIGDIGQGFQYKGRDLPPRAWTVDHGQGKGVPGFTRFDAKTIYGLPSEHRVNTDADVIRRRGTGVQTGIPQVLLNYAPVSRGPWRLRAIIDRSGHAVTSRFVTVRPKDESVPLEFLWALLNSPVANAYAFCHSDKRQTKVGTLRKMPTPRLSKEDVDRITGVARETRARARPGGLISDAPPHSGKPGNRLLLLDAEILRLYDLSPRIERELLELFAGHRREGVGFEFDRYFPEDFEPCLHLHEYLSEEFRNSQASVLLESHKTFDSPEVSEAFQRATDDFGG